jgi:hypothetical protein
MTLHESKAAIVKLVASRNGAKIRSEGSGSFYDEFHFNRMFDLERMRTKRSRRPFILILINITSLKKPRSSDMLIQLQHAFLSDFRETDIRGWYKQGSIIGIVFTELGSAGHDAKEVIFGKTLAALNARMGPDELQKIYITFHSYPKDLENTIGSGRFDLEFHHGFTRDDSTAKSSSTVRGLKDLGGGFLSLVKLASGCFIRPSPKIHRQGRVD